LDKDIWHKVQNMLENNAPHRRTVNNVTGRHHLIGRIFDENGNPLCPTHTVKDGRRYLYYVSKDLLHASDEADPGWRLSAKQLEKAVTDALIEFLKDEGRLFEALEERRSSANDAETVKKQARLWVSQLSSQDGISCLRSIVHQLEVLPKFLRIAMRKSVFLDNSSQAKFDSGDQDEDTVHITVPVVLRKRGVERKMVLASSDVSAPDEKLIALVARSHRWLEKLTSGTAKSIKDLAGADKVDPGDVSRFLPLAYLAPDIVEAILSGRQPFGLTVEMMRRLSPIPLDWNEQRQRLNIAN
jgi:site-specific DNA recombinase